MSGKLVKEIVTTTTERFSEEGSLKEKITETKEKVYESSFSEEEIQKAETKTKSPKKKNKQKAEKKNDDDLIAQAAKAIDAKNKKEEPKAEIKTPEPIAQIQPKPEATVSDFAKIFSNTNGGINPPKFPWEK